MDFHVPPRSEMPSLQPRPLHNRASSLPAPSTTSHNIATCPMQTPNRKIQLKFRITPPRPAVEQLPDLPTNSLDPAARTISLFPQPPPQPRTYTRSYYTLGIEELKRLCKERGIHVPRKIRDIRDSRVKRDRYAACLEGNDVEVEHRRKGWSMEEMLEGTISTLRRQERKKRIAPGRKEVMSGPRTMVKTIVSVPTPRDPWGNILRPPGMSGEKALEHFEDIHLNEDDVLHEMMRVVEISISEDREKNIAAYRQWLVDTGCGVISTSQSVPKWTSVDSAVKIVYKVTVHPEHRCEESLAGQVIGGDEEASDEESSVGTSLIAWPRDITTTSLPSVSTPDPSELESDTSPEPISPIRRDYSNMTAAALRRECLERGLDAPCGRYDTAGVVKATVAPFLKDQDEREKRQRNRVRAAKRRRIEVRMEKDQSWDIESRTEGCEDAEDTNDGESSQGDTEDEVEMVQVEASRKRKRGEEVQKPNDCASVMTHFCKHVSYPIERD